MKRRKKFIAKLTALTLAATTIFSGNIMADVNSIVPNTIESAKEQVSIAQAEWESAKQEYDAIAEQAAGPKAEKESAKSEYESISNTYHEAEEQEVKARQDLENGPAEEENIQKEIASQKEKIESESEALVAKENEKAQGEEKLSAYQAEYETLQNQYEEENAKLEQESEEMESCSQANEKAVSEMESLYNQKKSVYESAKADYEKESETVKNLSNALEEAKESESIAQNQYNNAVEANVQAQKKVEDVKAARDTAIEQESKGSIGFFEKQNATQALYDLRNCTYKEYVKTLENGATEEEAKKSATSLDNMKQAFVSLHWHQDLIRSLGMGDLKITHVLMAHAQANADYSSDIIGHSKQFSGEGENLSWGYKNPFDGWYTKEKAVLDAAMEDTATYPTLRQDFETLSTYQFYVKYPSLFSQVGHYMNIIDKTYQYTGMAYGTLSTRYSNTYSQEFRTSTSETSYTLDEYEKMFNEYYNAIHTDIDNYDNALAEADEAKKQETATKTALEQVKEQVASLTSELTEHQNQLENYDTVQKGAEKEFTDVQSERETLNIKVQEDNQKYETFVQQYAGRVTEIQKLRGNAETALNQKNSYEKNEFAQIIAELDTAQTNYDSAVLGLEQLETEYTALQERLIKAQQYLDEYSLLKESLEADLEKAKSVYEEKNEIYSEIAPILVEKQAILTQCETNLNQATQKLEELEKEEASKNEETSKTDGTTKSEETSNTESKKTSVKVTNKKTTKIKKVVAKKKAVKVTWKKVNGVAGYQIQYANNKSFKKAKIKTINKAKTTSKVIKKLKSKKKYYFRIRTFIKNGSKKVCSNWSKAKKVKV